MAEKWQLLDTFSSESEMLAFFNTRLPRNAITHKNKSKCTHCGKGEDGEPTYPEHDMMVIYRSCRSRGCGERCPVRYKLIVCEVGRIYNSFKLGEHPVQILDLPPESTNASSNNLSHEFKSNKSSIYTHRKQLVEHNGMDPKIKRNIEKLVKSGETNASKILAQISKTKDTKIRLPTLYQVQSYVSKNRSSLASPKSRGVSLYNNQFNQVTRIEDDEEEDTQSEKNVEDEHQQQASEETMGLGNSGTEITDTSSLFSESNEANAAVSELLKCLLKQSAIRSTEPSMAEVLSAFGILKRFLSGRIVRMQTTLANLNQVESLVLQASGVDEIVDRIDEFLDNTGVLSK